MAKITPILVSSTGIGRLDNSISIARSVSTTTINQFQVPAGSTFIVPTIPYPFIYWTVIYVSITQEAALIGFNMSCSGDTNATSVVGAQIYNSYDVLTDTLGTLFDTIFLQYAPKVAEVHVSKGYDLRGYEGKALALLFAHYSANPLTVLNVTIHGLVELTRGVQVAFAVV